MIPLSAQGRRLLPLLYLIAIVILLDQAMDLLLLIWPLRLGTTAWRFGTFGLGVARLEFLALADGLALATAALLGHRRVLIGLGILHVVVGIALAAGTGLFLLDGLELRGIVQAERQREVDIAALRTLLVSLAATVASLITAWMVLRSERDVSKLEKAKERYLVTEARPGAKDE